MRTPCFSASADFKAPPARVLADLEKDDTV